MKRPFILFVCVVVLASSVLGTYALLLGFKGETGQYRASVREHSDRLKQTDLIVLTLAQYNALGKSFNGKLKEFEWQGNRYDVLQTEMKDGKVFLSCFNDEKEKNLRDKSALIASDFGNNEQQKNLPSNIKIKIPDFFFEKAATTEPALFSFVYLYDSFQFPLEQGNYHLQDGPPPRA